MKNDKKTIDGFYLLKPDMLIDQNAINYYLEYLRNTKFINQKEFYIIEDWPMLSRKLYEPDFNNLTLAELKKIRKQLLVTIKGYDVFYRNYPAILSTIDIKDASKLQELFDFKKELRRRFVYGTKKHYIRFNTEVDFNKKLEGINLDQIEYDTIVVDADEEIIDSDYNIIFFNKMHFPDPSVAAIKKDLDCISNCNIINSQNLIKNIYRRSYERN